MTGRDILAFQFGRANAIRTVASSSSAIWTGIVLVLLTAFARNYDQTFILTNPLLWLIGPLAFSLVSGSFLFRLVYGIGARNTMPHTPDSRPELWRHWRGFMGAFWLTAPIAWLYALPVERYFDPLIATRINIGLLSTVALWRVILMARVMQVVCQAPFRRALLWVLGASFAEVLLVGFFGGPFGKALMSSMGGMRNSPEEELLLGAFSIAAGVSFWGIPVVVLLLAIWRWPGPAAQWPALKPASMHWKPIVGAALFWIVVTIPAQVELRNNHHLEQLVVDGRMREAIDYMNARRLEDFAPARPLPPKLYEFESVAQAFQFVSAVTAQDREWVRHHARHCLEVAASHHAFHYRGKPPLRELSANRFNAVGRYLFSPAVAASILTAANRAPEITDWLQTHTNYLAALRTASERESQSSQTVRADWKLLSLALDSFFLTNVVETRPKGLP